MRLFFLLASLAIASPMLDEEPYAADTPSLFADGTLQCLKLHARDEGDGTWTVRCNSNPNDPDDWEVDTGAWHDGHGHGTHGADTAFGDFYVTGCDSTGDECDAVEVDSSTGFKLTTAQG